MANDDWAVERAKEIKEERQDERTAQENANKRIDFIKVRAPLFWNQVKDALQKEVADFNSAIRETDMLSDASDPFHVSVRNTQNGAAQNIRFDQNIWQIQVYGVGADAFYSVNVEKLELLQFLDSKGVPRSPEDIAKTAVMDYSKAIH